MAEYTVIGDVTAELVRRLRKGLTPDIIYLKDSIGFVNDITKTNYILNVFLYNIVQMDRTLFGDLYKDSLMLSLEYMLVACSKADPHQKALEEQMILGRALQIFNDAPVIYDPAENDAPAVIAINNLSFDDKAKISPKNLALFYQVSPIIISSKNSLDIVRVMQVGEDR